MCIIILSAHLVYSYFKYRYNIIYKVKLNNYLFFGGACQQGLLFVFFGLEKLLVGSSYIQQGSG